MCTNARTSSWSAAAPASRHIPNCWTLEAAGAGTQDLGIEIPKRIALDRQGRVTEQRPLRQIMTSWDKLQRLLRATIDPAHYHLGRNFERVDQDERGVRVQFSGGHVEHADILVGGDGIRSGVRAQVAPELQPIYAGYYIWRGAPEPKPTSRRRHFARYIPVFRFVLAEAAAGHHLSDLRFQR